MKNLVLIILFFFTASIRISAQEVNSGFAVVELFTSEGCSSCPPAEKVLSHIVEEAKKNHKNIFCLEYHVDYWNRSGWKDPFSKNQFTMRQNNYTGTLQQRELYTPQMIVNGETEFIGSHADEADAAISKALKSPAITTLEIGLDSAAADTLYLHYASSKADKNYSLHFALVENHLVSKIGKGENSGKTLTHDGVVRIFYSIELNNKTGVTGIPLKGMKLSADCDFIAFAQHKQTKKILGAVEKKMNVLITR